MHLAPYTPAFTHPLLQWTLCCVMMDSTPPPPHTGAFASSHGVMDGSIVKLSCLDADAKKAVVAASRSRTLRGEQAAAAGTTGIAPLGFPAASASVPLGGAALPLGSHAALNAAGSAIAAAPSSDALRRGREGSTEESNEPAAGRTSDSAKRVKLEPL